MKKYIMVFSLIMSQPCFCSLRNRMMIMFLEPFDKKYLMTGRPVYLCKDENDHNRICFQPIRFPCIKVVVKIKSSYAVSQKVLWMTFLIHTKDCLETPEINLPYKEFDMKIKHLRCDMDDSED